MKKILKRIWNRVKAGIKGIPAGVYILLFVSLVVIGLQAMLFSPFMSMLNAHKDVYIESSNIFAHKSADTELLNKLFENERSLRDSFINVDLNGISNPIEHLKAFVLIQFAKLDVLGQCFIALGFVFLDLKLLKLYFKPLLRKFSREERANRKAQKVSKKEEKIKKVKSKHA